MSTRHDFYEALIITKIHSLQYRNNKYIKLLVRVIASNQSSTGEPPSENINSEDLSSWIKNKWVLKNNRPFYSWMLSLTATNTSEVEGDLALIQSSLFFSFKWQLVSKRDT